MAELVASSPWLTIIGIGEDGIAGLGDAAKQAIAAAELVFGGTRHLELAEGLIIGEKHRWLSPIDRSVELIKSARGRAVCVLASGDPFHYGMGATLTRSIDPSEMHTIPAPSAFSLAASRLGWPIQETALLSLHGRPLDLIRPHLQPCARLLVLTSDEKGPAQLAELLNGSGFGKSSLIVLEALGGERERITHHRPEIFALDAVNALNLCAIEVVADANARIIPLATGLDDGLFEHDGQITKREIRAVTLSALAPRQGELLWDIGGGSGSVSIEWMLAHPAMRAIAIESDPDRSVRIARNAASFGVPSLRVVTGSAPAALAELPQPDAIFIGGGGSEAGVMDAAVAALRPGGRLVANAVTLEMEAVLLSCQSRLGGSLIRIDIARASPVGTMQGWRASMPVTQWNWAKPDMLQKD
jgi:precorrin-6Y C5,15-methyltransferase (decarboxylating)